MKFYLFDSLRIFFKILPIYLPQTVGHVRASSVSHKADGDSHVAPPLLGLDDVESP
jgi:hypothetical protein